MVALISSLSVIVFARLEPDAGAVVSGKVSTGGERAAAAAE